MTMMYLLLPLIISICSKRTDGFGNRMNTFRSLRPHLSPSHGIPNKNVRHLYATISTSEQQIESLLEKNDIDGALLYLEQQQSRESKISAALGAKLVTAAASLEVTPASISNEMSSSNTGSVFTSPLQEQRLLTCYSILKTRLAHDKPEGETETATSLFNSVDMNNLPCPNTWGYSIQQLEQQTNLPLSAFRPNPASGSLFWLGGAALCVLEVLLAGAFHISPQPLFLATFAAGFADQILGGGASEKIMWTLNPAMAERVLRHEAGHLLVAHLLGCPVQSVSLGAWDALTKEEGSSGGVLTGAGTSFFDPAMNAAMLKGKVTRSVIDRFSVVLMAGIAAEALCFGDSEGGGDDENTLKTFLSQTVQSNVNIPEQARWAATNALVLLRGQREAYDRLVDVLRNKGSQDIGQIMMAMEGVGV